MNLAALITSVAVEIMSLFFGIYEIDLLVGSIIFLLRYVFLSGTCLFYSLGRYGGCYPTPDIFEWDPNYVDLGKLKKFVGIL